MFPVHNDSNPIWPVQDGKIKASWNDTSNDQWSINNSESGWNENIGKNDVCSETPESPPMYEKSGFNMPLEYDDSQLQEPILSSTRDVDHRYNYYFYLLSFYIFDIDCLSVNKLAVFKISLRYQYLYSWV